MTQARVFSDTPRIDRDELHFEPYAHVLAELALNPDNRPPFTVLIRGDWGRGKTTLMRLVEARLAEESVEPGARNVETLWFDAWKYSSEDSILAGLLGRLIKATSQHDSLTTQFAEFVNRNKGRVAGAIMKVAAPFLEIYPNAAYGNIGNKRAYFDEFRALFAELWLAWQEPVTAFQLGRDVDAQLRENERDHVLAVFLDDLDRCGDATVQRIIETLYLLSDIPGVCFYLGVDFDRLTRIVRTQFAAGRPLPESATAADRVRHDQDLDQLVRDYLEKIYQVSIALPPPGPDDVGRLIRAEVEGTVFEDLLAQDRWLDEFRRRLDEGANRARPRFVKQVLNEMSVLFGLLKADGGGGDDDLAELALAWTLTKLALEGNELVRDLSTVGGLAQLLAEFDPTRGGDSTVEEAV